MPNISQSMFQTSKNHSSRKNLQTPHDADLPPEKISHLNARLLFLFFYLETSNKTNISVVFPQQKPSYLFSNGFKPSYSFFS